MSRDNYAHPPGIRIALRPTIWTLVARHARIWIGAIVVVGICSITLVVR